MQGLRPPPGLDEGQLATWRQEGGFLAQLLDNSAAEDYQLPIPINGTLRRYQQVGRQGGLLGRVAGKDACCATARVGCWLNML